MIHVASATETIRGDNAKRLLNFCMSNSRYIILSRSHREEISDLDGFIDSTIEKEKHDLKEQITNVSEMNDCELRHETGFRSRGAVLKGLTESARERIRVIEEYRNLKLQEQDRVLEELTPFGIVKKILSIGSFVTFPGIFDLCYFSGDGEVLKPLEEDFFCCPITFGGYEFEDASFEDYEGNVWMSICPHKRSFSMRLTDEKYKNFEALRICHSMI